MITFPVGGALEVPLDEATWAGLVGEWDPAPTGAWEPSTVVGGPEETSAEVQSAVRLLSGGDLVVEVMSSDNGRALASRMTLNGSVLARATRALRPVDGGVAKVPGVLVGIGSASQLVGAVAGTLAGLGDDPDWADEPAAALSPAVATTVMDALKNGDDGTAVQLLARAGLDGVPETIASLRAVGGDVAVAISNPSGDTVVIRALRGDRGWVLLSLDGGNVVHRALTRSSLEEDLTFILAGMTTTSEEGS